MEKKIQGNPPYKAIGTIGLFIYYSNQYNLEMILIGEYVRRLNAIMFLIISIMSGKSVALVYLQWSPLQTPTESIPGIALNLP